MIALAVSNRKGGTAKTTLTATLGVALAALGYPTVMIDCDTQGSLSGQFGLITGLGLVEETLYRALVRQFPADGPWGPEDTPLTPRQALREIDPARIPGRVVRYESAAPLWLLPGYLKTDVLLRDLERRPEAYGIADTRELLRRVLDGLPPDIAFAILDSPPSYPLLTTAIDLAVDAVIVPTLTDYLSLTAVIEVEDTIRAHQRANPGLQLLGVVPTQTRRGTVNHDTGMGVLRQRYGDLVMDDIPYRTVWTQAAWEGQTVLTYEPTGQAAVEAWSFAAAVLERLEARQYA